MPPETAKLLNDMREAACNIVEFTAGKTYADYLRDKQMRFAVERNYEIIGEAMTRLIKHDVGVASQIAEYRRISGFRNALIHGYDVIDHAISWSIVGEKLPILQADLDRLLAPPAGGPEADSD